MQHPIDLDPKFPPPNPERISLLMALDWDKPLHDGPRFLANATIKGRPITETERTILGKATVNDLAVMDQLMYEALTVSKERLDASNAAIELLARYGLTPDGDTVGDCRRRMSPDDAAEFDRLADILWPDGYIWIPDQA